MQTDIADKIINMPIEERKRIVEKVSESIRRDMGLANDAEPSAEERHAAYLGLKGALAVPGKIPPTDEEIIEDYTDYLIEKYK